MDFAKRAPEILSLHTRLLHMRKVLSPFLSSSYKFAGEIREPNKFPYGQEHVYPSNEESFLDYASYAAFLSYIEGEKMKGGGGDQKREGQEERESFLDYTL